MSACSVMLISYSMSGDVEPVSVVLCLVGMDAVTGCVQRWTSRLRRPGDCNALSGGNSLCTAHCLHFSHGGSWRSVRFLMQS